MISGKTGLHWAQVSWVFLGSRTVGLSPNQTMGTYLRTGSGTRLNVRITGVISVKKICDSFNLNDKVQ